MSFRVGDMDTPHDGYAASESSGSETDSSPTTTAEHTDGTDQSNEIAAKENRAVGWSRVLVIIVLAAVASTAGTLTYLFTSQAEENEFENDFAGFASQIFAVSNKNAQNVITAFQDFSISITSYALASESSWPNVTIPDFERRLNGTRQLSQAGSTSFYPIVQAEDRAGWEAYSVAHSDWVFESQITNGRPLNSPYVLPFIWDVGSDEHGNVTVSYSPGSGPFMPLWQTGPDPADATFVNWNVFQYPSNVRDYNAMVKTKQPVLTEIANFNSVTSDDLKTQIPTSVYNQPVLNHFGDDAEVVGAIQSILRWDVYFQQLLGEGTEGIYCVVRSDCKGDFEESFQDVTFLVEGPEVSFIGAGDLHEPQFENLRTDGLILPFQAADGLVFCSYSLSLYPSQALRDDYDTRTPILFTSMVVLVFVCTSMVFVLYDCLVRRRQEKVMYSANRTNAIVSSLFPAEFRDRIFDRNEKDRDQTITKEKHWKTGEREFPNIYASKPIAELFPSTTIMFADIVNFTAWSSSRSPSDVFVLLETIYTAFDEIAKNRGVFKVETIGDCYVAVCGLPRPRADHALVMARFSRDCMMQLSGIVQELDAVLGPGTADLGMRFGLHSGQATAGVLRGDKARFQLFGDTVNTASRIEHTGARNRIHMSQDTAELLKKSGKSHWLRLRDDKVEVKGKGVLETYWLQTRGGSTVGPDNQTGTTSSENEDDFETGVDTGGWRNMSADFLGGSDGIASDSKATGKEKLKLQRLIEYNIEQMLRLLKQIVAERKSSDRRSHIVKRLEAKIGSSGMVLDEVANIIALPKFESKTNCADLETIDVGPAVVDQLREYVTLIAHMYRNNPFHNFEHASHVALSVNKLLLRIEAPDQVDISAAHQTAKKNASELHDHTYGITSDPLTRFSIVLASLMHDVDHRGVPNGRLIEEDAALASTYSNKSVAEQNSLDIGWSSLMEDRFADLRACIYADEVELLRFRQILVNSILATDIFDKELGALRTNRWNLAFSEQSVRTMSVDDVNRKATIVIEHILQASDVAHTMQHWQVYKKWNEKLFHEMHQAYKAGRSDKAPADGWYKGELWFFDNYVIPLAKKLESCGVFGVSSDECLNYAVANRREWAQRGEGVVAEMVEKYNK